MKRTSTSDLLDDQLLSRDGLKSVVVLQLSHGTRDNMGLDDVLNYTKRQFLSEVRRRAREKEGERHRGESQSGGEAGEEGLARGERAEASEDKTYGANGLVL